MRCELETPIVDAVVRDEIVRSEDGELLSAGVARLQNLLNPASPSHYHFAPREIHINIYFE